MPDPINPTPIVAVEQEEIARIIHGAMRWAADRSCTDKHPEWRGGNSEAEYEARNAADKIAALPSQSLGLRASVIEEAGWQDIATVGSGSDGRVDLWVVRLSSSGKHHDEHRAPDCYMKDGRWHSRWQDARGYPAIEKHYTATHWRPTPPAPPAIRNLINQDGEGNS